MFNFAIDDEVKAGVISGFISSIILFGLFILFFTNSYTVVRVDVDGNKYISSDVEEISGDYYYKNADGDLIKIQFYDDDFKK